MIYYGIMYAIDVVNYYLIYRVFFHVKFINGLLWKMMVLILGFTTTELFLGICGQNRGAQIVTLACLLTILVMISRKRQSLYVIFLFPIAMLFSMSVNVLGTYFFSYLFQIPYVEFMNTKLLKLISELPILCVLSIMNFLRRNKEDEMINLTIPKYLIVLLGTGSLFILVGIFQGFMLKKDEAYSMIQMLAICSVIIVVIFVVLIIWQVIIEKKAYQYQQENAFYRNYLEKQEMHIQDIIDADQKMRCFRHDIRAHITALEAEIENDDMEALKQYLHKMKEESEKGFTFKYTGIAAVDAVIGEWHQKAVEQNVKWKWEGECFPQKVEYTFELCVIFSNLLSNALEATVKINGERKIDVFCKYIQGNTIIRVCNTCQKNVNTYNIQKTSKKDKQNHGFGLKNTQAVVEKYNGSFKKIVEDGVFVIEIII